MSALSFILTPMLLIAAPPDKSVPDTKWDGKLVIIKDASVRFGEFDDGGKLVKPMPLTGLEYRILAEKNDRLQIKTVQGVTGWIKKSDALLVDDAVTYFSKRIQEKSSDFDAYNRRALCWKIKGEQDLAIKDFTDSIRLNPNAATYNNRAIAYVAKKDYDSAMADYDQAIRLYPQQPLFYSNRGSLWNAKKERTKAIEDFSAAIRLDPKLILAINNRAFTYMALKDYAKALEDYARVLELDPRNYQACNSAAWLLATCPKESVRDGKRAIELAKQAVSAQKANADYLDTLAAAYAEVGNFDEAVRLQEQVLQTPQFMKNADARARLDLYKKKQPYRLPE